MDDKMTPSKLRSSGDRAVFQPLSWTAERNLMNGAIFLCLLSLPLALLIQSDMRLVYGVSTWMKPWKFSLSLGLHLASIAIFWPWLSPAPRDRWTGGLMIRLLLAMSFFELFYIASQAAIGQDSHYNVSTPFTQIMFQLMGLGAVILVATTFIAGIAVLRAPADGNPVLRRAIGLGLVLSGALGMITGAALGSNDGHLVGVPGNPADVVPLFNWSREVGDLRIGHFFGLHALQIVPLVGWIVARHANTKMALHTVHAAAALTTLVSLATLGLALSGRPIF
ncbi:hypothetical protein [Pararhizobium antarcticum]|uniref:Uncharacterized protein n=1 Tax=Pararhizobium antarcticum TaxID=1798805 RepID=A0A657LR15_9HYPH|nr:hypothetical protein [Pararhizobium antarcticum]OJF93988.1 hypothetical protein AX760_20870 [Pararhizobium antarcticum]OJF97518.1 hypothetical protein AX761_14340 [Rhizobium sp. 58]